jgi:uncharacterized membrane protein YhaH (DUF805 family)
MLHRLMPLSVVLARLRRAAHPRAHLHPHLHPLLHPSSALIAVLHELAAASRATGLAAHQLATVAAHQRSDPLAYYEIAATVIPLLYLATVYQANALELRRWGELSSVLTTFMFILWPVIGAAGALQVLAVGHATSLSKVLVTAALVGTAVVLTAVPLLAAVSRRPHEADRMIRGATWPLAMCSLIAVAGLRAVGVW